jgi:hypothetical protein
LSAAGAIPTQRRTFPILRDENSRFDRRQISLGLDKGSIEAKNSYRAMTDLTVVQIERDHPGNGVRNEIPDHRFNWKSSS